MWQIKSEKGIMVQFLISLLLCLMIFIPACYLVSGIFRTSEQAQDNYSEFVLELNKFAQHGQIGERKSVLLIMDDETAIVYFQKAAQKVLVEVDARLPNTDYSIELLKQGQCDDAENCLCLFRESEFETTVFDHGLTGKIIVTPQKVVCTNLDYDLTVETCSIGQGTLVESYSCSNGFMLERGLAKKSKVVYSYYDVDRRTVLYFIKEDSNTLHLIGNYGGTNE